MELVPYLSFSGNAEEVLNFYAGVFNGEIAMVSRYGDAPMPCDEDYKQKIMHARLTFGGNMLMVSDAMKGRPVSTHGNIQLSVGMEDAAEMEKVFNKLAEGGMVTMPLADQFWGARFGMLQDRFGVSWMFNCDKK